ncbi:MAG TPA: 30S ribosomal protein S17 [Deltaproteobacteria bacterium]|nr:30S ribosomal protein S17 [Candidatus Binatota bacterium]HIL13580.1 30S ribosomal protein S17 [Deltaproteobacteria bacterium]
MPEQEKTETQAAVETPGRQRHRTREGVVVSAAMDKTVVVVIKRRFKHRRYHKYIQRSKRFMVHDEENTCREGDRVLIAESRPLSRNKRWRLREVIERSVQQGAGPADTAGSAEQGTTEIEES